MPKPASYLVVIVKELEGELAESDRSSHSLETYGVGHVVTLSLHFELDFKIMIFPILMLIHELSSSRRCSGGRKVTRRYDLTKAMIRLHNICRHSDALRYAIK